MTAFVDGSNIYGSDGETSTGLRAPVTVEFAAGRGRSGGRGKTFPGARLKTQMSVGHEALPSRSMCGFASPRNNGNPKQDDLTSGDTRAVEQPALTSIHTLFLYEHNRIVDALYPLWENHTGTKNLTAHAREDFIFEVGTQQLYFLILNVIFLSDIFS